MTRRTPAESRPDPGPGHNSSPAGVSAPDDDYDIVADRLNGCREVSRFWLGRDDPEAIRKTFRLIEANVLPVGRIGGRIVGSKRVLRRWYEKMASGESNTRRAAAE